MRRNVRGAAIRAESAMMHRGGFHVLALCAGFGLLVSIAAPTGAEQCDAKARCKSIAQAKKPPPPLRLGKFRRRPVALGTPVRAVKTDGGEYRKVRLGGRAKPKSAPRPEPQSGPPQFLPVVVAPEAAAALAMREAATRVRVVEAGELNEIDLAAGPAPAVDETPIVPVRVATTVEPPIQAGAVKDGNPAQSQAAPAAATPAASIEPEWWSLAGLADWYRRFASWLGDRTAAAAAALRGLFG
jgi:hypothetical protein